MAAIYAVHCVACSSWDGSRNGAGLILRRSSPTGGEGLTLLAIGGPSMGGLVDDRVLVK